MKLLDLLRFRIATLFQRSQVNAEMEEELRSHIEHRADDLERTGLTRAEAERRARIEFGGHVRYKEESREAAGGVFIESFLRDVRFAVRLLRKSPGFTVVAVVTLAMAIGANAVVFSVLNALILRPLNVPQAESLYQLMRGKDKAGNQSFPDYRDLRDRNRSFDEPGSVWRHCSWAGYGRKSIQRLGRAGDRELLRRITPSAVSRPFVPPLR